MSFAQRLTKRFYSYEGVYYYTYPQMKAIFDVYLPKYVNGFVLFKNETDLANAVAYLDNYADIHNNTTPGDNIFTDMGKDVRLGLQGGESCMYTYRLVQRIDAGAQEADGNSVYYVMVDQQPSANVFHKLRVIFGGATDYGTVWVQRGY